MYWSWLHFRLPSLDDSLLLLAGPDGASGALAMYVRGPLPRTLELLAVAVAPLPVAGDPPMASSTLGPAAKEAAFRIAFAGGFCTPAIALPKSRDAVLAFVAMAGHRLSDSSA